MIRPLARSIAAVALVSCTAAQAAPRVECLTREELGGLTTVVLPGAIDAVATRCAPVLPAGNYLLTGAKARADGLRALRAQAMPQAKRAFIKFGAAGKADKDGLRLLETLPDDTLVSLIETAMVAEMLQDVKPDACGDIDRVARTLAPLPTENLVQLISELFALGTRNDKDIRSCPI